MLGFAQQEGKRRDGQLGIPSGCSSPAKGQAKGPTNTWVPAVGLALCAVICFAPNDPSPSAPHPHHLGAFRWAVRKESGYVVR